MANGYAPRPRSLAGPIVLILVGVVFLFVHTLHVIPGERLGEIFARYWPLLLIFWGVVRLVEYQRAKQAGTATPGVGAGGVLLLVFLIIVGVSASGWYHHRNEIGNLMDQEDMPWFGGDRYSFDDQLSQEFPANGSLRVVNDRGAVTITTSDDKTIKVLVHKRVSASDQDEANKYNEQTKPQLTVVEKTVTLNANVQAAGSHRVTSDMDVFVPRNASVVVTSGRGDVSINGRDADVEISSRSGEVTVDDVKGNAKLEVEGSSVRVSRISGDVSVDGHVHEISVSDVKGSARLSGEFSESVNLSRIGKTVSFKSSRTDLEFSSLDGSLDLDGGDLRGTTIGGSVRLLTKEKDIRLEGVAHDVRVSNSDGVVEVRVSKLPVGSIDILNRNADVQIYLPDQAGFRVDARTDNGEVQSDFNGIKVSNENDRGEASGTVGNGVGTVKITNSHGAIEIRKGSAMAATPPVPPEPVIPAPPKPGKHAVPKEGVQQF